VISPFSHAGNFVSVIEDLQNHPDRAVYKSASDILSSFFEPVSELVLYSAKPASTFPHFETHRLKTTMMILETPRNEEQAGPFPLRANLVHRRCGRLYDLDAAPSPAPSMLFLGNKL
jgi:hypothetical protein